MVADLEITPVVPTLAGVLFATRVIDDTDLYDLVPISSSMRTIVVLENTDQSDPHTVTFTSQPDTWGNAPTTPNSDLNKAIIIPAKTTVVTGVWIRPRWGDSGTDDYTCLIVADSPADINVAVINVPNASK